MTSAVTPTKRCDFQRSRGLLVDGQGRRCHLERTEKPNQCGQIPDRARLSNRRRIFGVEVAAIKAVAEVEKLRQRSLPDGRTKILFERHKPYKYLAAAFGQKPLPTA